MRSSSLADSKARYCSSGSGCMPRRFKAQHASRMVSRRYRIRSSRTLRPFSPGCAPSWVSARSLCNSAACARFNTIYGHSASIKGPIERPWIVQTHAGLALACRGRVGPEIHPPASSWTLKARTSSVVDIDMTARHCGFPWTTRLPIMYDPSPSSRPARYAASTSFINVGYLTWVAGGSYWKTSTDNLRALEAELSLPSLFDEEAS